MRNHSLCLAVQLPQALFCQSACVRMKLDLSGCTCSFISAPVNRNNYKFCLSDRGIHPVIWKVSFLRFFVSLSILFFVRVLAVSISCRWVFPIFCVLHVWGYCLPCISLTSRLCQDAGIVILVSLFFLWILSMFSVVDVVFACLQRDGFYGDCTVFG